jgi:hypothetical protein
MPISPPSHHQAPLKVKKDQDSKKERSRQRCRTPRESSRKGKNQKWPVPPKTTASPSPRSSLATSGSTKLPNRETSSSAPTQFWPLPRPGKRNLARSASKENACSAEPKTRTARLIFPPSTCASKPTPTTSASPIASSTDQTALSPPSAATVHGGDPGNQRGQMVPSLGAYDRPSVQMIKNPESQGLAGQASLLADIGAWARRPIRGCGRHDMRNW